MRELSVVLGAGGGVGAALVQELVDRGRDVRAVNRGGDAAVPEGTETRAADLEQPGGPARAVEGAAVVYMAAQPPYTAWPERFPPMLEAVIDATAQEGAKLVMVDNLYMYGPGSSPIAEDTPERATDPKGRTRRAMGERLIEAHASGALRVTLGRFSDYLGPGGDNGTIGALMIGPASRGKTMRWPGAIDQPHAVAYLPDVARALVTLGEEESADGEAWILPHAPAVDGAALAGMVDRTLPEPVGVKALPAWMLRVAGVFNPMSRELAGIAYQFAEPFEVDDSRFRTSFEHSVTPLEEAVEETMAWYLQRR